MSDTLAGVIKVVAICSAVSVACYVTSSGWPLLGLVAVFDVHWEWRL